MSESRLASLKVDQRAFLGFVTTNDFPFSLSQDLYLSVWSDINAIVYWSSLKVSRDNSFTHLGSMFSSISFLWLFASLDSNKIWIPLLRRKKPDTAISAHNILKNFRKQSKEVR